MADRNQLTLVGRINGKIIERTAQNGSKFMFFPMAIDNRFNGTTTDNNYSQDIHVMVFNPKVVEYLRNVGAREGNRVVVFGFISAFKNEHKGETIISNAVNGTDVFIVKTKAD